MKKLSKKKKFIFDYRYILGLCTGLIIAGTSAYAITVASNTVTYDNTNSGLTSTNVQNAIDEVYSKANSKISDYTSTVRMLRNTNIVGVKKYDETSNSSTYCVTGDESTCKDIVPGTYAKGTVVFYKVNNNTTETFYVIHDDGNTLTMQAKKNTIDNVQYATKQSFVADGGTEAEYNSCVYTDGAHNYFGCSTRGPVTILPALESATNSWTNVNIQTYTPGTTSFLGNNKTGCTSSACSENTYTMTERSGRARLITVPEAWETGCQSGIGRSCPKYMYNYLKLGDSNGAIVDGNENSYAYWTMNACSDDNSRSWGVYCFGKISESIVGYTGGGARAVVEINK